jgi:zinc protease
MQDIQGITLEDCRAFYATYYAPNNATLVVAGDVDPAHVLAEVEARYAGMPAAVIPAEDVRVEPEQRAERRLRVSKPTAAARLAIGYKSPAMGDADHVPAGLLNEILFGGRSSRVHRKLVQQLELASEVHGSVGSFRDPSLWDMFVTGREGVTPAALDDALGALLTEVARDGVSAQELRRAQARSELSTLSALETVSGKAEQVGFCEVVLGDPAAVFARLEQTGVATVSDLQRVAERYLRSEARTVIEVAAAHADDGEAA